MRAEQISAQELKQRVGFEAAALIPDGALVGLGTGSTANCFIKALIQRVNDGLNIQAVATSEASYALALDGGITLLDVNDVEALDITVDGADEIDPQKRMIKGGGGALLREKLIASMSKEMIVIIDQSKQVKQLGAFGLPVEIVPFAYKSTLRRIEALGYEPTLRLGKELSPYVTDGGHYIADLRFPQLIKNPEETQQALSLLPGVVDTGLFLGIAGRVLVGLPDGSIDCIP